MAITYPLITVSTRSQVDRSSKSTQLEIAKKILKEEGISGLYSYVTNLPNTNIHHLSSGMKSAIVGIAITQAVYYYWYELIKDILAKKSQRKSATVLESMVTGGIAGSITALFTNPIWVINVWNKDH